MRMPPQNEGDFGPFSPMMRPTDRGLDDLLLEDLLRGSPALLRGLVLVLRRKPVPTGVAHDRVRGDHRPARRARDLARLSFCRLLLDPVPSLVASVRVQGDYAPV